MANSRGTGHLQTSHIPVTKKETYRVVRISFITINPPPPLVSGQGGIDCMCADSVFNSAPLPSVIENVIHKSDTSTVDTRE